MLDMQNQYREQLIQSEKLSTRGILVAGVAHEINNPNQFILTNSELVRRAGEEIEPILNQYREEEGDFFLLGGMYSETGEKVSGYLRGITEGSKRINKIVTDLKSYARTEPREQPLAPVLLNEVVESSVNLCRNLIKNSTNHFSLSLAGENPIVLGSAQRLEQVVINLIQNACHALTDPSQGIAISTAVDDTEGRVRLVVSDQGSGIDKEVMDKIALPFFTTKRTRGGTGLGLSISQRIVEEHKGLISFSSDPGKGTEVTVTLPCADPAESSVLLRTAAPGGG
jgi:polar amino acid transport system substrate-binding protein